MYDPAPPSDVASANEFGVAFAKIFGAASDSAASAGVLNLDWIESPVGPLLAGATHDAVLLLEFSERETLEEQLQALRRRFPMSIAPGGNPWLEELRRQLADYFAGQRRAFDLPLRYPGTAFQEKVWNGLLRIPYGETWSYRDLALHVGDAKASRAVGMANGTNRLAILIPCHRVVNSNGTLGGYGGGSWRKRLLLDLERGQGELLAVVRGPIETYK
jgi:AraC family transcriptional regulator of adaptative response/methylated-DNA-[protein]-cysteine methyltransferase